MAAKKQSSSTNSKTRQPAGNGAPFLTNERKMEILGVIMMSLAALVALSVFTYNSADNGIIQSVSFSDLASQNSAAASRIQNYLGPLGALMSYYMVYSLFGYMTIIIPALILVYGWFVFRHHDLSVLHRHALYYTSVMLLGSTVFGWFNHIIEAPSLSWSGAVGSTLASALLGLTASWGSGIILFSLVIVALLFLIDRDIQATIDRFKTLLSDARTKAADWKESRDEAAAVKRAEKEREEEEAVIAAEQAGDDTEDDDSGDVDVTPVRTAAGSEDLSSVVKPLPRKNDEPFLEKISDDEEDEGESPEERQIRERREELEEVSSRPPRAIIDRESDSDDGGDDEDSIDINIYKGEEEEKAGDRDLRKAQKTEGRPVIRYKFPGYDLLDEPPKEGNEIDLEEIRANKKLIIEKLKLHGITILNINAIIGPTVTLYELQPAPDVKISKIEGYANDLKMAMATHGLRIIAPIPGKSAVGIEVPNRKRETVYIKDVIATKRFADTDMTLPVAFGKTIENEVFMLDLTKLPHVLVAGATGSGKSVGINTIITCLLYKVHPQNLKFVLIDPKKIELALYRNIQNHYLATLPGLDEPIITDTSQVQEVLNSVCKEMDDRYDLLKMGMVRDIKAYNKKYDSGELEDELGHRHLPYIVVIIDELADLMITAGKGIEEPIARIAQLARAVGIHLVVATQRPSVNVITGTIKANFPARIAYRVASKVDSRTILDTMGADQLVGKGDMLYTGGSGMIRVQNAFVSTEEVERINAFIGAQQGYDSPFYLPKVEDESGSAPDILDKSERDDLFEEAAKVVVLHQQGSVSLLQRKLKLGYNRAGRIIDQLFAAGIVGPYQGSTARDVLVQDEEELAEILREIDA
ncbi:MAG: DNA translocase FtsK [Balneolia bacterium]|nr:DNA translocase FtsK [Balneolia bacterium]